MQGLYYKQYPTRDQREGIFISHVQLYITVAMQHCMPFGLASYSYFHHAQDNMQKEL